MSKPLTLIGHEVETAENPTRVAIDRVLGEFDFLEFSDDIIVCARYNEPLTDPFAERPDHTVWVTIASDGQGRQLVDEADDGGQVLGVFLWVTIIPTPGQME